MITPIRGRKHYSKLIENADETIRNDNPDKGTEILLNISDNKCINKLEMITPIRGRKLYIATLLVMCYKIRNDNPDKGTEIKA